MADHVVVLRRLRGRHPQAEERLSVPAEGVARRIAARHGLELAA
jgi:hypothetical protein